MQKQKTFIVLSPLVLLITVGIFFGLISPTLEQIEIRQEEIQAKETELQELTDHIQNLRSLFRELEELREPLSKLEQALPDAPNLEQIFVMTQKLSGRNGLLLKRIDTGSVVKVIEEKNILGVPVRLTALGTYQDFKNFLLDIERSAKFFNVEKIAFSSPKDEIFYTFRLEAKVHFYSPALTLSLP